MTDSAVNQSNSLVSRPRQKSQFAAPANRVWLIIAWSLLLVYLLIFVWVEPLHQRIWLRLLVPDDLMLEWTGGDWSRFSLVDRIPLLLLAAGMLLAAAAWGRLLLRPLRVFKRLSAAEGILFSLAVGLSCLSLATLLIGWLGWLQQGSLFLCLLGLPVLGEAICIRCCTAAGPARSALDQERRAVERLSRNWLWLLCPLVLVVLLGGMLPPQEFDVREYHLQVPKEWYQAGQIEFLPHNVYGNMPLGAEILSIPMMAVWPGEDSWWWGAMIGKVLLGSFGLLTAWALYLFGRRWFSTSVGMVAAIVFLGTPWVLHICLNGLVEMAVAFYGLMAVYATYLWRQQPADSEDSRHGLAWSGLAGFFAGSAVACKYPALLLVVLPLALYLALHGGRRAPQVLLVFIMAVSMGCGLWFAKNLAMAGNPTYPLLDEWVGDEAHTVTRHQDWKRVHQVPRDRAGRRYSMGQFWDSLSHFAGLGQLQSPLLIPLALLGLIWGRRHPEILWVAALIAYTFLSWWLLTHRIERFWVPMLPLLALLAGLGAVQLCRRAPKLSLVGILLVATVYGVLVGSSTAVGDNRFLVDLLQLRDGPTVVEELDDTPHAHVHRYLNQQVSASEGKVLLVGDAEPFDLRVPVLYNTCFDDCIFEQLLRGRNASQRLAALKREGITHVFIYWNDINRYRQEGNYGFTPYVTPDRIRKELVDLEILRPIEGLPFRLPKHVGELFEVGHEVAAVDPSAETRQEEP